MWDQWRATLTRLIVRMSILAGILLLVHFGTQVGLLQFLSNPAQPPVWPTVWGYLLTAVSNSLLFVSGFLFAGAVTMFLLRSALPKHATDNSNDGDDGAADRDYYRSRSSD